MATVAVLGTLDTKGVELAHVSALIRDTGCATILIDVGVYPPPSGVTAEISGDEVARAAGIDRAALVSKGDRGAAMTAMGRGAGRILLDLRAQGRLDAVLSMGGSGGASVASAAMRQLPVGVPKLLVTTVASGQVAPYVGETDMTLMYSVLDIAGLNSVSEPIFANAAAAIAGMAKAAEARSRRGTARPAIALTMFGVTTPGATVAREWLEGAGYEVLVFHANGAGGRTMDSLIRSGAFVGVLDLTTTELADELVGGVLTAGPDRLEAAGRLGIPQVVSLGALDMVNFGPIATVPPAFADRTLYRHNDNVTLMRTTAAECAALGALIAEKLNRSAGPTALFMPLQGVSALSVAGNPFHDPHADAALFAAVDAHIAPRLRVERREAAINDPAFAREMAMTLDTLIRLQGKDPHVAS